MLNKLKEVFEMIDADKSGTIDKGEIMDTFAKINGRTSRGITVFMHMDIEKEGGVTMDEFKQFWTHVLNTGTSEQSIMNELNSITEVTNFADELQRLSRQPNDISNNLAKKARETKSAPSETYE